VDGKTWKTTSVTQCLVNTSKYTCRRNPSVGKTPLVFVNSSTCIAIAKSIHKMHVTIFHVGKHKWQFCSSLQATHSSYAHANETAFTSNASLSRAGKHSERVSYNVRRTVHGTARRPHFSMAIISVTVQRWI
jgi:hypothetical protein